MKNSMKLLAVNVPALGEVAVLKAQMFNLAQMYIKIPNVRFSTEPATSPSAGTLTASNSERNVNH
jgi:hypothetical protein